MFGIGEFARHGQVSVRMLRHYDAIGLLAPAHVDPSTGYRSYDASQFARLNRIVALKDLGFTLQQVSSVLDDRLSPDELRGMLRLRRAELHTRIGADHARLAQVEARLHTIEKEGTMPGQDIQVKSLPRLRLAEKSGRAAGFEPESITPVISPLYDELWGELMRTGIRPTGPGVAWYEDLPDGGVLAHAGVPVGDGVQATDAFAIAELPAVKRAACLLHRGPMDGVMPSIQALARWVEAGGHTSAGYNREVYLEYGHGYPDTWVTELQEPLA